MKFETKRTYNTEPMAPVSEEKLASLFQPDVLLTQQYLDNFRRKTPLEPEKALLLAVLDDAVRCFQDNILSQNKKKQLLFEEAEAWLFSEESDGIFSFVSICALLGFDPGYVRRGLRRWQQRALVAAKKKQRATGPAHQRLVA
jgi:hypothetical protein